MEEVQKISEKLNLVKCCFEGFLFSSSVVKSTNKSLLLFLILNLSKDEFIVLLGSILQ